MLATIDCSLNSGHRLNGWTIEAPHLRILASQEVRAQGKALLKEKDYSGAEEEYTRGIGIDESQAWLWSNRAIVRLLRKKYADAAEDAKKAIELDESLAKAYNTRIKATMAIGKLDEALEAALEGKENLTGSDKQNMEQYETTIHRRVMARINGGGAHGGGGVQVRVPWSEKPAWGGTLDAPSTLQLASGIVGMVLAVLHVVPLVPLGGYERYVGTLAVGLAISANARGIMSVAGPVQFTSAYLQQALIQRFSPGLLTALTCLTGTPNAASLGAMWLFPGVQALTQLAVVAPALAAPLSSLGRWLATSALGMKPEEWDAKSPRQRLAALEDPAHKLAAQLCLLSLALGLVEMVTGAGSISTLLVLGMLVYLQSAMNPHMRTVLREIDAWGQESLPAGMQGTWSSVTSLIGSFDPVEQARKQHEQQQRQQAGGDDAAGAGGGGIMGQLGHCTVS